jgi:hypothetical protein
MMRGPTPAEYFEQEFAAMKREFDADHLPALFDAVKFAHINKIALPEWGALAVMNLIIAKYNSTSGKKRLRSKYALDWIHWVRWQRLSLEFNMRDIAYSKRSGRPTKEAAGKISEARTAASESLSQHFARGTPRQMQISFDLVEKARVTGTDARFVCFNR